MKRVAILKAYEYYRSDPDDYYGDSYSIKQEMLCQHITEFQEISDEDFEFLKEGLRPMNNGQDKYILVEDVTSPKLIASTIAGYKKIIENRRLEMEKAEEARVRAALERAEKKKTKSENAKRKQLAKLAEELGFKVSQ